MKLSRIGAGILAGFCLVGGTAAAADEATYKQSGKTITISGSIDADKPGETVGVTVVPDGISLGTASASDILFVNQQISEEGEFIFSFELSGGTRDLTAWISREYGTEAFPCHFTYKNTDDLKIVLTALNAAKTAAEVEEVINGKSGENTNAYILGVQTELLSQVNAPYTNIYQAVLDGAPYTMENFSEAAAIFASAVKVERLSQSRDAVFIREQLEAEGIGLGAVVAEDKYEKIRHDRLKDGNQIYVKLAGRTFRNAAELRRAYQESVVLAAVEMPKNGRFDVQYVLTACKGDIGIDDGVNAVEALSDANKIKAYEQVTGKAFPSTLALESRLKELAKNKNETTGSVGGSARPSGGGGGGISIAEPQNPQPLQPIEEELPENAEIFWDLESAEWAREAVLAMYELGVVNGREDGSFAPNDSVTREEFLKMAVLTAGAPVEGGNVEFEDVPQDAWYYSFVQQGVRAGITQGIGEDCFGVGLEISRQDMAVMVYRVLAAKGIELSEMRTAEFTDAGQIADYAAEAVARLYGAGIINGNPDGSFAPGGTATRAEAAKMLYGIINLEEA